MGRYVINILASQDLNTIADYFASNNVEAGEIFFKEFNRKCQQLVLFPQSGKSYAYIPKDLRELSLKNYIVFYRVLGEDIEILRVISGRRNFSAIFSSSE